MAAVTWKETAGIGWRVVPAAADQARAFQHFSRSNAARQPHNLYRFLPSSLGLTLLGAQAYMSAATTLPTLVPRSWKARKCGGERALSETNALTWKLKVERLLRRRALRNRENRETAAREDA